MCSDLSNRGKKTHVEHAIGFIEDERLHGAEVDVFAVDEILQTARSGDDHASTLANGIDLTAFSQPADDQGCRRELFAPKGVVLIQNLHGEFARWNEHEGLHGVGFLLQQFFEDGDQKRQGLAGSSLRCSKHILAFKGLWDGRSLHRSRFRETARREPLLDVRRNR